MAPTAARPGPAKHTPSSAALAVWEAEDGRCEGCHRPMDRACARVGRDRRGDQRLVCPDCKERRPDPLTAAIVAQKTTEHVAAVRGMTLEAAASWLADGVRAYGVLVRLEDSRRLYWLPGVGVFSLLLDRGPDRPPLIGGPLGTTRPRPEIRIKPQARTRGLPRLRAPGTAPDQHTKDLP
jgi:hypothetical protein